MGETSWHYFVTDAVCACGHKELEILEYANQNIKPADRFVQVLAHKKGVSIQELNPRGIYHGYCHNCKRTHDIYFTPGEAFISKRSVTLGA